MYELAGEFGVLDGRVLGYQRSLQFEVDAAMDRVRQVGLKAFAPAVERIECGECTARPCRDGDGGDERALSCRCSRR